MKVAFIPPLGWEKYFLASTGIQMALALEHLMATPQYVNVLRDRADLGDLVIVDNGEAEGQRSPGSIVAQFAQRLHASEVVLPDVMGDRHLTIQRVTTFFASRPNYWPGTQYMAVVQGKTLQDYQVAVNYFAAFQVATLTDSPINPITTIGIPRNMCKVLGAPSARIDLANWIEAEYPGKFQIHMLGASAAWPLEVKYAAKYAPHIRSIDTSLPFNYALRGQLLEMVTGTVEEPIGRHEGYLVGRMPKVHGRHVNRNLEVFKRWAEGR